MQEINIYKITQNTFSKVFTKVVETAVSQDKRCYVLCKDEEEVKKIDYLLWSYSQLSFIPHGTISDNYHEDQIVLIGCDHHPNPNNNPELLFLLQSLGESELSEFTKQYQKILIFSEDIPNIDVKTTVNLIEQGADGKWVKRPLA